MQSLLTFLKSLKKVLKEPVFYYIVAVLILVFLTFFYYQRSEALKLELARQTSNVATLNSEVLHYKVISKTKDSLNAAQVSTLEYTLKEYKQYHEDDLRLIKSLQTARRDLQAITTSQSKLIAELQGSFRDTTIFIHDTLFLARSLDIVDPWFELHGYDLNGSFSGTFSSRDSLLIVSTYKYKRFLGFLWKTSKVLNKHLDVVSKNPYNVIENVEHIEITK